MKRFLLCVAIALLVQPVFAENPVAKRNLVVTMPVFNHSAKKW